MHVDIFRLFYFILKMFPDQKFNINFLRVEACMSVEFIYILRETGIFISIFLFQSALPATMQFKLVARGTGPAARTLQFKLKNTLFKLLVTKQSFTFLRTVCCDC